MSPEEVHEDLFKGANKKFRKVNWTKISMERHNKPKDEEQIKKISTRLLEKEKEKRKKIQELGLDYDFPGYEGKSVSAAKTEEKKVKAVKPSIAAAKKKVSKK